MSLDFGSLREASSLFMAFFMPWGFWLGLAIAGYLMISSICKMFSSDSELHSKLKDLL